MTSYYDIDAILAEEELIPSTTLFDFSHLGHLDPDSRNREHYLPEASRIKIPLWAVKEWAMLGFVRLSLPRHYGRKARERLEADPGDADLRKRNEHFFLAGQMLVDLVEQSCRNVAKAIAATRQSNRKAAHTAALEQVSEEGQELRRILLKTYAGERLRRTFDWALSSGGDDDVSGYLSRLTEMEQRLFASGALAIVAYQQWSMFGNRRLVSGHAPPTGGTTPAAAEESRPQVTPGGDGHADEDHRDKRRRLD